MMCARAEEITTHSGKHSTDLYGVNRTKELSCVYACVSNFMRMDVGVWYMCYPIFSAILPVHGRAQVKTRNCRILSEINVYVYVYV